jgi:hypothetical protein
MPFSRHALQFRKNFGLKIFPETDPFKPPAFLPTVPVDSLVEFFVIETIFLVKHKKHPGRKRDQALETVLTLMGGNSQSLGKGWILRLVVWVHWRIFIAGILVT